MKRAVETENRLERKSLQIQFWLRRRGICQRDIVRNTGRDDATVSRTIHGKENNRFVIGYLKEIGVPRKYLGVK